MATLKNCFLQSVKTLYHLADISYLQCDIKQHFLMKWASVNLDPGPSHQ